MSRCNWATGDIILNCFNAVWHETDELQKQLYIVYGVFGGIIGFMVIILLVLISNVSKLKSKVRDLGASAELEKRGFAAYTGRPDVEHIPIITTTNYGRVSPIRSPPPAAVEFSNNVIQRDRIQGGVRVLPSKAYY